MTLVHVLSTLDVFHHAQKGFSNEKRELYGHLFGKDIPAHIIFHAMLGYVLLGFGACAIAPRITLPFIRRHCKLHPYLGYTWVLGTVWMPVTAVWCVYKFPGWDIIAFFIFSMFAAIQVGWLAIKGYQAKRHPDGAASLDTTPMKTSKIALILKILHAVAMIYSFIMLLGAGISFPLRSFDGYEKNDHQTYTTSV